MPLQLLFEFHLESRKRYRSPYELSAASDMSPCWLPFITKISRFKLMQFVAGHAG